MNFSTNAKLATFLLGFFLFSLFFVFEDAYSISIKKGVEVYFDKDSFTVGDEPTVHIKDPNLANTELDIIEVKLLAYVTKSTAPVTISTIELVEEGVYSGTFSGKFPPIKQEDLVHQSGSSNNYLAASYTPEGSRTAYKSAFIDFTLPPEKEPIETGPKVTAIGDIALWKGTVEFTVTFYVYPSKLGIKIVTIQLIVK